MKFCPHCGGDLSAYLAAEAPGPLSVTSGPVLVVQKNYDQTATWKRLMQGAREVAANPPDITALAIAAANTLRPLLKKGPVSTIVHLVFDREVVPQGGMLHQDILLDGRLGKLDERFEASGYSMEDGKIKLVDDMPVGPIYGILDYWGGEKQHKRWHLSEPVTIDPSRNGEPFFMDENMLAFGVKWKDDARLDEGILELLSLLERGVGGAGGVAQPIAMEIVAQPS